MNSHWIVLISEFSIVVSVIGIVLGTINYKHNKKYLSLLKAGIKEHDYTGNMVQWRENKLQKSSVYIQIQTVFFALWTYVYISIDYYV